MNNFDALAKKAYTPKDDASLPSMFREQCFGQEKGVYINKEYGAFHELFKAQAKLVAEKSKTFQEAKKVFAKESTPDEKLAAMAKLDEKYDAKSLFAYAEQQRRSGWKDKDGKVNLGMDAADAAYKMIDIGQHGRVERKIDFDENSIIKDPITWDEGKKPSEAVANALKNKYETEIPNPDLKKLKLEEIRELSAKEKTPQEQQSTEPKKEDTKTDSNNGGFPAVQTFGEHVKDPTLAALLKSTQSSCIGCHSTPDSSMPGKPVFKDSVGISLDMLRKGILYAKKPMLNEASVNEDDQKKIKAWVEKVLKTKP